MKGRLSVCVETKNKVKCTLSFKFLRLFEIIYSLFRINHNEISDFDNMLNAQNKSAHDKKN